MFDSGVNTPPVFLELSAETERQLLRQNTGRRPPQALIANPRVALLVHDFREGAGAASSPCVVGTCSITLYGDVSVKEGEDGERLRAVHLVTNPDYANFISGEGIAVLWLQPTLARLVDLTDTVSTWTSRPTQSP